MVAELDGELLDHWSSRHLTSAEGSQRRRDRSASDPTMGAELHAPHARPVPVERLGGHRQREAGLADSRPSR